MNIHSIIIEIDAVFIVYAIAGLRVYNFYGDLTIRFEKRGFYQTRPLKTGAQPLFTAAFIMACPTVSIDFRLPDTLADIGMSWILYSGAVMHPEKNSTMNIKKNIFFIIVPFNVFLCYGIHRIMFVNLLTYSDF
jgi:hypothetical protein